MKATTRERAVAILLGLAILVLLPGCCGMSRCCPSPCCPSPCAPACNPCPCDPCYTNPCAGAPACPPGNAMPGEAWCRVYIPPQYEEVECQVCVCPAQCERTWIEPVYETRTRRVCVCPEQCRTVPIPAEYRDEQYEVCVCPARTEWKQVDCKPSSELGSGEEQGECWVLCEVPAVMKTCTRRVCVKPASCTTEVIPARYEEQEYRECVQPGRWETREIPAQHETRKSRRCVAPGRWEWRLNRDCAVPAGCLPGSADSGASGGLGQYGLASDAAAFDAMLDG
jgi:hypothetical protein